MISGSQFGTASQPVVPQQRLGPQSRISEKHQAASVAMTGQAHPYEANARKPSQPGLQSGNFTSTGYRTAWVLPGHEAAEGHYIPEAWSETTGGSLGLAGLGRQN